MRKQLRQHKDSDRDFWNEFGSLSHRRSTIALAAGLIMTMALGGCMTVDSSVVTRVSGYGPAVSYSLWTAGDVNQTIRGQRTAQRTQALGHCRQRTRAVIDQKAGCL